MQKMRTYLHPCTHSYIHPKSIQLSTHPTMHQSTHSTIELSILPSVHPSIRPSIHPFIHLCFPPSFLPSHTSFLPSFLSPVQAIHPVFRLDLLVGLWLVFPRRRRWPLTGSVLPIDPLTLEVALVGRRLRSRPLVGLTPRYPRSFSNLIKEELVPDACLLPRGQQTGNNLTLTRIRMTGSHLI